MAKNSITDYSKTASLNTDIQSVDIDEGCLPSGINNAIRELMADLAAVNDGTVALTSPAFTSVDINSGTIDGVTIGGASAAAGTFTTFTSTGIDDNALSTAVTINSSNNVGIGTSSPAGLLELSANNGTVADLSKSLRINNQSYTAGTYAGVLFQTADTLNSFITAERVASYAGILKFAVNAGSNANDLQERMRIDSIGRVGIGTSSPTRPLTVNGNNGAGMIINDATNDKALRFRATGDAFYIEATNNAESAYANLALEGNLGIGTATPSAPSSTRAIEVVATGGNAGVKVIRSDAATAGGLSLLSGSTTHNLYGEGAKALDFWTNATARMRIDSSGNVLVGTTLTAPTTGGIVLYKDSTRGIVRSGTNTTAVDAVAAWYNPNGKVGQITTSGSSTSYSTTSDYRLKENVTDITDGIERVKQLNPSRFNFIADADTTVDGFLAHEAQAVVPEAVHGEKDAVDADGNPEYQGIDQAKLVPLLTAALQEAIAKIETLETKVAALENA